jgi:hypothetical protein
MKSRKHCLTLMTTKARRNMITTDTRTPYIYGEILSRSMYQAREPERPGIGRFLSQGAAAGAITYFMIALIVMLKEPQHSPAFVFFFFLFLLPFVLVWGMLIGLFVGLVIWVATKLVGELNVVVRSVLGIVALVLFATAFYSLLTVLDVNWHWSDSPVYVYYLLTGVAYGAVIGSTLQPWRELVRGSEPAKSRVLAGITGLVLRVLLICGLMESILSLCVLQSDYQYRYLALIALSHFAVALVIVFARLKFWLLLLLAVLVNTPIVWLITEFLKNELPVYRYLSFSYLAIWAMFLLARCSLTYSMLASLKEELRYYLID